MAKDEIKRHPQVEEETETTEVAEAEIVEETEEFTNEPVSEEVMQEAEEALEDYEDEEAADSEDEEEQSVYDDADDEFMESVSEKPLSPEKAAEKEKKLLAENEELRKRVEELEAIDELNKHQGWEFLMENLKSALHVLVDKEDSSLSKNAKKLEEIKAVRETLGRYSSELYSKRSEIKSNERELEGLKAIQKNLFEGQETEAEDQGEKAEV